LKEKTYENFIVVYFTRNFLASGPSCTDIVSSGMVADDSFPFVRDNRSSGAGFV
jgi:hypothetical protein